MRTVLGMSVSIAALASLVFAMPRTAVAQTSLCAMLPQAEAVSVVGMPLKLSEGKIETSTLGGGLGKIRSQICNYDPPGGIGSGPTTVMVTFTATDSPSAAAQWFKAQQQFSPVGKGDPLPGLGDEALTYSTIGAVSMRKKNVLADIHVGRRDLNFEKERETGKALGQKIAAHVQ